MEKNLKKSIYVIESLEHLKLAQHCKLTILQFLKIYSFIVSVWPLPNAVAGVDKWELIIWLGRRNQFIQTEQNSE